MKILVIRFSSIGDIVLTTPVVRCIKKTPGLNAEIHYATKREYAGILEANPNVDMVHCLNGDLRDLIRRLKMEQFDQVIDLHKSLRSIMVRLALRRPSRSFCKLNFRKYLLTRFKFNRLPAIHLVDRYMTAVKHLGVVNDLKGLDYFIPVGENNFPNGIPGKFRQAFIAMAIGARHFTKRLPNEKIIEICRGLSWPVVLLGGPEDKHNGDIISDAFPGRVFNACGMLSLNGSAYMLKSARAVITHDTGLMHIAAAFKKRIISIWGNTVPEFGMFPYMPGHENQSTLVETEGLSCRPCSKIGFARCPKRHFDCMQKIDTGLIAEMANSQTVKQANSQTAEQPNSQTVKQSNSRSKRWK